MFNVLLCLYLKSFWYVSVLGVTIVVKCRACAWVEDQLT